MPGEQDPLRRAVAGLRTQRGPSRQVEARMLAALQLELGHGGDDGGGADGAGGAGEAGSAGPASGAPPLTLAWVAKSAAATATLTAAGLLLVWGLARALPSGQAAPPAARTHEPITVTGAAANTSAVQSDPAPSPAPAAAPERNNPGEARPQAAVPSPPSRTTPEPSPDAALSGDQLELELALIRAARESADPQAALTTLETHAQQFPAGLLADEREALRAIALCQLERTDEARALALALVAKRPRSPLRQRMQQRCPALRPALEEG